MEQKTVQAFLQEKGWSKKDKGTYDFNGLCFILAEYKDWIIDAPAQPPVNGEERFQSLINLASVMAQYSQIHTVTGVIYPGQPTHAEAIKQTQAWLRENCDVVDSGYRLKVPPGSPAKAEQESQEKRFIKEIGLLIGAPNPYEYTVEDVEEAIRNGEQAEQEVDLLRRKIDWAAKCLEQGLYFEIREIVDFLRNSAKEFGAEQEGPTKDDLREQIEANQHANMPLSEAEFQAAYCEGIDKGYEKAKREQEGETFHRKVDWAIKCLEADLDKDEIIEFLRKALNGIDTAFVDGLWYVLKEEVRGEGNWQFYPSTNRLLKYKPKGPEVSPVDDRQFYIWIPGLESAPKEAGQVDPVAFDDAMEVEINKLPYKQHLDDGGYNDGQLSGFEKGANWAKQYLESLNKQQ